MTPRTLRSILGICLMGLVIGLLRQQSSGKQAFQSVQVEERLLGTTIEELGTLEPRILAKVPASFSGVVAWVADDATEVQTGDVLFRQDNAELNDRISLTEDELRLNREDLLGLQDELTVLTSTYEAIHKLETAELSQALLERTIRTDGLTAIEREKLEIEIKLAELDLQDQQNKLDRQNELVSRGFASPLSLETHERKQLSAAAFLEEKKLSRELQLRPLAIEEKVALDAEVKKATEVVNRSKERHLREIANKQLAIEATESEIRHSLAEIEVDRAKTEQAEIFAPTNGLLRVMRRINFGSGSWELLTPGTRVWMRNTLGEIIDPTDMRIEALLHETDANRITENMKVEIQLTAYPESLLTGTVSRVTSLAQDRSELTPLHRKVSSSLQAMFLAVIEFDGNGLQLRPGMTSRVYFNLEPKRMRRVLPRGAVITREDGSFEVQVSERGETVSVTGSFREDGWFELSSDLSPGSKVLIPVQEESVE